MRVRSVARHVGVVLLLLGLCGLLGVGVHLGWTMFGNVSGLSALRHDPALNGTPPGVASDDGPGGSTNANAQVLKLLQQDPYLQAIKVRPTACYGEAFEPCYAVLTARHGTVQVVGPDHRLVVVLPEDGIDSAEALKANADILDAGRHPGDGPLGTPKHQVLDVEPVPESGPPTIMGTRLMLVHLRHASVWYQPLPLKSPRGLWWFTVPEGQRSWGLAAMDRYPLPDPLKPYASLTP